MSHGPADKPVDRRAVLAGLGSLGAAVALGACSDTSDPGVGSAASSTTAQPPMTGASTTSSSSSSTTAPRRPPGSVAVVGAGLAGLTAAYRLSQEGWDVTVVEARDRLGGRVATVRAAFEEGEHAEAGGEFIGRHDEALLNLIAEIGLQRQPADRKGELDDLITREGQSFTTAEVEEASGDAIAADRTAIRDALAPLVAAVGRTNPTASSDAADLDGRSVAAFLDDLELGGLTRFLVERELVDAHGVEASSLSLLRYVHEQSVGWTDPQGPDRTFSRIKDGADRLPRALAELVDGEVVLSSPVRRIDDQGDAVVVHHDTGEVRADAVIVTTPLPLLATIAFDAGLPELVQRATAELRSPPGTRTFLQYAYRFWREAGWTGTALTDLVSGNLHEPTETQPAVAGIFAWSAFGDRGVQASLRPQGERTNQAIEDLDLIAQNASSNLKAALSISWSAEAWSRGVWSAWAPGQVVPFWDALRTPFGRVRLAGEHTSDRPGTMEGAVQSGQRAAEALFLAR